MQKSKKRARILEKGPNTESGIFGVGRCDGMAETEGLLEGLNVDEGF